MGLAGLGSLQAYLPCARGPRPCAPGPDDSGSLECWVRDSESEFLSASVMVSDGTPVIKLPGPRSSAVTPCDSGLQVRVTIVRLKEARTKYHGTIFGGDRDSMIVTAASAKGIGELEFAHDSMIVTAKGIGELEFGDSSCD